MTITLTNAAFNNLEFVETVKKIYRADLPSKEAYRLFKMLKELNERASEYDEIKHKMLVATAVSDGDDWTFENTENAEKFKKEFEDLLEIEFTLNTDKIMYPESLNMSAYEMEIMAPLFDYENLND